MKLLYRLNFISLSTFLIAGFAFGASAAQKATTAQVAGKKGGRLQNPAPAKRTASAKVGRRPMPSRSVAAVKGAKPAVTTMSQKVVPAPAAKPQTAVSGSAQGLGVQASQPTVAQAQVGGAESLPMAPQVFDGFEGKVQQPFSPTAGERAQVQAKLSQLKFAPAKDIPSSPKEAATGKAKPAKRIPASPAATSGTKQRPK